MIILGLHFGHDASVSVIDNGEVLNCLQRERRNRIRHAMSLSAEDIQQSLSDADLSIDDVDYCAITSSQMVEYLFEDPEQLSITLDPHPRHDLPCTLTDTLNIDAATMMQTGTGWVADICTGRSDHFEQQSIPNYFKLLLPGIEALVTDPARVLGSFEDFVVAEPWESVQRLTEIAQTNYRTQLAQDTSRHGFHYPATLRFRGQTLPAYIFSHHYAHMAYAFYTSPFDNAAVFSHDGAGGGMGYGCGMFGYGQGNRLYPLTPHHLAVGELYDMAAFRLGLGVLSGAGKLMGLAGYGEPRFVSQEFAGNWFDVGQRSAASWVEHCEAQAQLLGYDMSALADPERILDPINVDIAASTQALAEQILMTSVDTLQKTLRRSGIDTQAVCLSGGTALNCPANTRIAADGPFESVFVPPAVSDEGLSMGSALALYHNLLDGERHIARKAEPSLAYLGLRSSCSSDAITAALAQYQPDIVVEVVSDSAAAAAAELSGNQIIAWFDGRSEIGPRALGHRSLLANPRHQENWQRVNDIKQREQWRPLAPAVLDIAADDYFDQTDLASLFMLMNSQVLSDQLPAVTHVDGSARVQLVTRHCGEFHRLLNALFELDGLPVVLNTSLNVRGEPIVETPAEAISFLLKTGVDVLILPGYVVRRS